MTVKSPWPIRAFKDRDQNECPRCKRVVPRDAVALRPAARDGLALGRDVALELESRIADAIMQASEKLDSFTTDPFNFFTEVDALKHKLIALGHDYLSVITALKDLEHSHAEWEESVGASAWSDDHKEEVDDVVARFKAISEAGRRLTSEYITATTLMRSASEASWVEVETRLQGCLRLVNRSRDFYDHLLSAQTAGDLAKATQQRALNETWNELATELADVSG